VEALVVQMRADEDEARRLFRVNGAKSVIDW
jgi:hypothetical protein